MGMRVFSAEETKNPGAHKIGAAIPAPESRANNYGYEAHSESKHKTASRTKRFTQPIFVPNTEGFLWKR